MLIPLGIIAAAGAGGGGGADLISTTLVSSATGSVTFNSIPATYKHLVIRYTARSDNSGGTSRVAALRFNSDTGSNYAEHRLGGNGSNVVSVANTAQTSVNAGYIAGSTTTTNAFGAGIIEIFDYASTSKLKTVRSLNGVHGSSATFVQLMSGLWNNTAAVNSITFLDPGYNLAVGTRVSLYGIKG